MKFWKIACLALLTSGAAGSAWGAETTGRITYMSADHGQLMLDNSRMYTLTGSSRAAEVAVGERVELTLGGQDDNRVMEIKKLS